MSARFLCAHLVACLIAVPLSAADLTKVSRTIDKEPVYKSKSPKYCLVVLGKEAKTKLWLVLDGDALYVDRNCNGDLTEPGERIARRVDDRIADENLQFKCSEIQDGDLRHLELEVGATKLSAASSDEQVKQYVAKEPAAIGYRLSELIDSICVNRRRSKAPKKVT